MSSHIRGTRDTLQVGAMRLTRLTCARLRLALIAAALARRHLVVLPPPPRLTASRRRPRARTAASAVRTHPLPPTRWPVPGLRVGRGGSERLALRCLRGVRGVRGVCALRVRSYCSAAWQSPTDPGLRSPRSDRLPLASHDEELPQAGRAHRLPEQPQAVVDEGGAPHHNICYYTHS